jgi:CBS domain-containing protein
MYLQEILNKKGSQVFLIAPQATLEEAVERLVKHNVGSLLVWQDESGSTGVVGIITERDILRAVASHRGRLESLRVFEVMTTHLITVSPHHSIEQRFQCSRSLFSLRFTRSCHRGCHRARLPRKQRLFATARCVHTADGSSCNPHASRWVVREEVERRSRKVPGSASAGRSLGTRRRMTFGIV